MYFPEYPYEEVQPRATFTVREGPLIVGYGVIRSRAEESIPLPLPKRRVELSFEVEHLDLNRLLEPWLWLCAQRVTLVARNGFGDLFFRTVEGKVLRLNVGERDGLVQPPAAP
jgi:hypothetical protein